MSAAADPFEARLLRVRGRVQGVGYRYGCVRQAHTLGLTGWVRNRSDGSVELLLQGTPEAVDTMLAWLPHGVSGARVDAVEQGPAPPGPRLAAFESRPTL